MDAQTPTKAKIYNLDKPGSTPVEVMFNPKEYAFSKQNTWNEGETPATNVPQIEFGGGQPATLTMQLLFDTFATKEDVREKYTDKLWEMMQIDPDLEDPKSGRGRPPKVRFQWGDTWSFDAVITSLKQNFTLFHDNGKPLRATVDISFRQATDASRLRPQNPTSGGIGGERAYCVQPGDTLTLIAYREYGDATLWRPIAEANRLTRLRDLTPGVYLVIPHV
jgi:nucleoid-associated protein YgaU